NAAFVLVDLLATAAALVGELDDEARVQERQLAKAAREHVVAVLGGREDLRVGLERHLRARAIGIANRRDGTLRYATPVFLVPDVPLAPDLHLEPLGDRVDGADADAVEARGNLVARVIEFPARVQHGHHDLGRADALRVHADRDAAAVVVDGDRAVE